MCRCQNLDVTQYVEAQFIRQCVLEQIDDELPNLIGIAVLSLPVRSPAS